LRPETGFDLHCVAELAVQLARFSAMAAGEFGIPSPYCRAGRDHFLPLPDGEVKGKIESGCAHADGFTDPRRSEAQTLSHLETELGCRRPLRRLTPLATQPKVEAE